MGYGEGQLPGGGMITFGGPPSGHGSYEITRDRKGMVDSIKKVELPNAVDVGLHDAALIEADATTHDPRVTITGVIARISSKLFGTSKGEL